MLPDAVSKSLNSNFMKDRHLKCGEMKAIRTESIASTISINYKCVYLYSRNFLVFYNVVNCLLKLTLIITEASCGLWSIANFISILHKALANALIQTSLYSLDELSRV